MMNFSYEVLAVTVKLLEKILVFLPVTAWSTTSGSVSMLCLIERLVFVLSHDWDERNSYSRRDRALITGCMIFRPASTTKLSRYPIHARLSTKFINNQQRYLWQVNIFCANAVTMNDCQHSIRLSRELLLCVKQPPKVSVGNKPPFCAFPEWWDDGSHGEGVKC